MNGDSAAPPRLRSARIRVVAYLGLVLAFQVLYATAAAILLVVLQQTGFLDPESIPLETLFDPFSPAGAVVQFGGIGGWIVLTLGWWKLVDRRRVRDLGIGWNRGAVAGLASGFLAGAAGAALVFAAGAGLGLAGLDGWQPRPPGRTAALLAAQFVLLLVAAAAEEIAFRGYLLQNMLRPGRTGPAVAISSVLFSAIHASNPHFLGSLAVLNIFLIGVLFCLATLWRRSLWLPIGLHLGWNFTLGPVLAVPVSGLEGFPGLLRSAWAADPALWSGGRFGPEGGLLCTLAVAVPVAVVLLRRPKRPELA